MAEYGVWSEAVGGFIADQMYSPEEAQEELERLVFEEGEDDDDLTVKAICPYHEEEPRDGCEECATEDDEGESDD